MTKLRRHRRWVIASLFLAVGTWALVRSRPDPATLPREIHVDIGAGYTIPREFVASLPLGSDGKPEHVLIRVLWPSMEPLTQANRHLWKPELPGRQILNILIQRFGADGAKLLEGRIRYGEVGPSPQPGPFGLMLYQRDHPRIKRTMRILTPVDINYTSPTGTKFVLDCGDMFNWESQKTLKLYPICKVNYPQIDSTRIHYHFYQANLYDWRRIDSDVRRLISSFRNP